VEPLSEKTLACVDNSCVVEPLSEKTLACVDNSCVVEFLCGGASFQKNFQKNAILDQGICQGYKKRKNCVLGLSTPFCFSLVLLFYPNVIPRLLISL
jgi:hypothetical protein